MDFSLIITGFLIGIGFYAAETFTSLIVGFITQIIVVRSQRNVGGKF